MAVNKVNLQSKLKWKWNAEWVPCEQGWGTKGSVKALIKKYNTNT